jgi:hypothetical protein
VVRRVIALFVVVLLTAACSPEETQLTTTTTTTVPVDSTTTTLAQVETTTGSGGDAQASPAIEEYEVVVRSSATAGETLWILIEPGDYTDIDLENLIRELVAETDVTLFGIHVFDDRDALDAGRVDPDARTDEEQTLVDQHFLVSLIDGAIIRFQGPYAEFGETVVGS